MVVKINMGMPKSCDKCPFGAASIGDLVGGRGKWGCWLIAFFAQYAARNGNPYELWNEEEDVKTGERNERCPLKEDK